MSQPTNEPVNGPADGPRMIFGRENANWRPSRKPDEPGSGAMNRRKSFTSATNEFNSAHDIGIDLEGVHKDTLVEDLLELLDDARKRQVQGEMDAIDAAIRLIDDPGDTPMDDFMDHEIELSMSDVDHEESAIGYQSVKDAYRRRRDHPETLRGTDLYRMIQDRLDFPSRKDNLAWQPALKDVLTYIDRIHEVLGDDWTSLSEKELIARVDSEMKQLDTSASFLDKDDPRYHDLINRYDGFSEVLEMIRKNPYNDKSLGEAPAPIVKKKGLFASLRSMLRR